LDDVPINIIPGRDPLKPVSQISSEEHATPEDTQQQGISGTTHEGATTIFVDDGQVTRRDESMVASRQRIYDSISDSQGHQQSLIDFLSKPIVIKSDYFSSADTFSFLESQSMPYAALTSAQGLMYLNKLKGYFGIAMDMRFRLVLNASRFQSGRYCIGFVPLCSSSPSTSSLKQLMFNNMHMGTRIQRTTVPHVEIDIATGTSAELLVPFMSPNNFYPLNAPLAAVDNYSLGYINVYPYKPLQAVSGTTVCSYTLYVSFENIRLFGAASPESGIPSRTKKNASTEIANKTNGPVSSVTNAISKGFKEFSSIPLIGSYANNVAWIADRVTSVASIFGFSKPIQGDCITKMMILNAPSHSNVDGDSDVRTLSFLQKPSTVQVEGLFGTEYDEMDFSYIVRKKAFFQEYEWEVLQDVTNIARIPVAPYIGGATIGGAVHLTPVAFVANQFFNWRGSLVFTFKLVKTEFHSGRLSFAFYPVDESAQNYGDPYYVNRIIVDIRETNQVEIVVPYIARNPWMSVDTAIGYLSIDIVDPLIAPDTVASKVFLLTELSGGDDFEVAIPRKFDYLVTSITPQSGFVGTELVKTTVGNSTIESDPILASSAAVGDKVTNYRQLLKRFTPFSKYTGTNPDYLLNKPGVFYNTDVIHASVLVALPSTYWNTDYYGLIASCYGMVKGGIRMRNVFDLGLLTTTGSNVNDVYKNKAPTITFLDTAPYGKAFDCVGNVASSPDSFGQNLPVILQATDQNNCITIEVPQYTNGFARSVCDMITFQTSTNFGFDNTTQSSTTKGTVYTFLPYAASSSLASTAGVTGNKVFPLHNLYRSAAEDTSFGVFISVPPLVAQTPTQSGIFY